MKLDKYHYHEALDRTHVFQSSFYEHITTHPVIVENERLKTKAEYIQDALMELYQSIANNEPFEQLINS